MVSFLTPVYGLCTSIDCIASDLSVWFSSYENNWPAMSEYWIKTNKCACERKLTQCYV